MTDEISRKIATQQNENEWYFCASILAGEAITAMRECAWLDSSLFINADLGDFWDAVKDNGDALAAANRFDLIPDLTSWAARTPVLTRVDEYARAISESYYLRTVVAGLVEVAKAAGARNVGSVRDELAELLRQSPVTTHDVFTPDQIDEEFRATINNPQTSILTHIPAVDRMLGGLFGSELTLLAARPGMGKTALAMQIARNVAAKKMGSAGRKVLFFSLEMSRVQLWARMACADAGYLWADVRSGRVDKAGIAKVEQASDKLRILYGSNLLVQDEVFTVSAIHQIVAQHTPALVVVDLLTEIQWHDRKESRVVWYGKAARHLRTHIARNYGIPVILVHQLSRKVEERDNKVPILSDLKWSGDLEEVADIVIMGYRDDYYIGRSPGQTVVSFELWARKQRQGSTNVVARLDYDLERQWFS